MACSSCGGKKAQQHSEPREITLPDGVKVTVKNASEERAARDQYWVRERARAREKGYRVQR
jgi:hypothetical protein